MDYAILFGVVVQIAMTAYFLGRLSQRVTEHERRLDHIEGRCEQHLGLKRD
jgi:hypothetical protein